MLTGPVSQVMFLYLPLPLRPGPRRMSSLPAPPAVSAPGGGGGDHHGSGSVDLSVSGARLPPDLQPAACSQTDRLRHLGGHSGLVLQTRKT